MGLNDTPWFSMGLDRFDTLLEGGSLTGIPWNPMKKGKQTPSTTNVQKSNSYRISMSGFRVETLNGKP